MLRKLGGQSLAYGTADVLGQALSFALIPVFTRFLAPADYGLLELFLLLATFLKIVFRLGLDSAFIRLHYDQKDATAKERFAGTVALFSAGTSLVVFVCIFALAHQVSWGLTKTVDHALAVKLVAADLLASSFTFVPQGLLRIEERAALFASYSLFRHLANVITKVLLLIQGYGLLGVLLSDVIASTLFALVMMKELWPRARLAFDWVPLADALRFGLPKVPHGLMIQAQNLLDRRILLGSVPLAEIGIYGMAAKFAGAMKFPTSAFEPAWQPFVFSKSKTTDGLAEIGATATRMAIVFVSVALLLSLTLPEVLPYVTAGRAFDSAAPLIAPLVLAFLFHGLFLLASIGIATSKQARFYPIVSALSAGTNIGLNLWLIPRYGVWAATWTTVAAYAVMFAAGFFFSRRLVEIPMGWSRIIAAFVLGVAAFLLSTWLRATLRLAAPLLAIWGFSLLAWRYVLRESDRVELRAVISRH